MAIFAVPQTILRILFLQPGARSAEEIHTLFLWIGDTPILEDLLRTARGALRRLVRDDAEEVVNEFIVKALPKALNRFDPERRTLSLPETADPAERLSKFLCGCLRRFCRRWLRSRRACWLVYFSLHLMREDHVFPIVVAPDPLEVLIHKEEMEMFRRNLRDALNHINRGRATVFVFRDLLGLNTAQTAGLLGISKGSVKITLVRARQDIRRYLDGGMDGRRHV